MRSWVHIPTRVRIIDSELKEIIDLNLNYDMVYVILSGDSNLGPEAFSLLEFDIAP